MDAPGGVTQEEGHTRFLHLPSAVLALIFLARRIQPFLFLVGREVEFGVFTNQSFSTCWAFFIYFIFYLFIYLFIFVRKNPIIVRSHVPTSEGFAVTI